MAVNGRVGDRQRIAAFPGKAHRLADQFVDLLHFRIGNRLVIGFAGLVHILAVIDDNGGRQAADIAHVCRVWRNGLVQLVLIVAFLAVLIGWPAALSGAVTPAASTLPGGCSPGLAGWPGWPGALPTGRRGRAGRWREPVAGWSRRPGTPPAAWLTLAISRCSWLRDAGAFRHVVFGR